MLGAMPTSVIGDGMGRLGAMSGAIRALWPGAAVHGPALTVWVRAGDNLKIHQALALAAPGDVLVVNGHGALTHALFGDLMATAAAARGIAGIVVDGAVRDLSALEKSAFPAFGLGSCASGPTKEGTGEVGYPIACGGVVCAPGDLIVGDADGVVVVPRSDMRSVLEAATAVLEGEAEARERIARGQAILR
jgi:RraA family protein